MSIFSIGLLFSAHHSHVNFRKVTAKLRDHHGSDARDAGCWHDIVERGGLWGEVHLHRKGPTSGGRVRKQQQDTSWAILTQKPGPQTLPQLCWGTQQSPPSLFVCYSNCPRKWSFKELLPSFFINQSRTMMHKNNQIKFQIYLNGM